MSLSLINTLFDDDFFRPSSSVAQDLQQWRRSNAGSQQVTDWRPTSDLKEGKNGVMLTVELPGVNKDDIQITLDKGLLTVSGTRQVEKKEEGDKLHHVERFFGSFSRTVRVPEGVTENDIKASFDNGVLTVQFPSKEMIPTPEKKRIDIQ